MIANRLLWAVAILMAALMLVAGCGRVEMPDGPRVVFTEDRDPRTYPQDPEAMEQMARAWLQSDVLPTPVETRGAAEDAP